MRLARWAAVLVALGGGAAIALREAPPETWAVPIAPGERLGEGIVGEVRRAPSFVTVTFDDRGARTAVRVERRTGRAGAPPLALAGRYRLEPDPGASAPPPPAPPTLDALTARLTAWESAVPRPPAFVAQAAWRGTPLQRLERALLDVILVLAAALALDGLPDAARRLRDVPGRGAAWVTASIAGAVGVALAVAPWGVWHSNLHGFVRIADTVDHLPPWAANLGLLHGDGWYAWMTPWTALAAALSRAGEEATRWGATELSQLGFAVTLGALLPWYVALAAMWGDRRVAGVAIALAALSAALLRVGASEAMYTVGLLALGATAASLELWLRGGGRRWLATTAAFALWTMQTRADLLALTPAWIAVRALTAPTGPEHLRRALRDPFTAVLVVGAALALVPRAHTFLTTEHPGDAGHAWFDPARDPRVAALVLVALWGCAAHPFVAARIERAGGSRPTLRRVAAVGGALLGVGLAAAWLWRPEGFDPGLHVHLWLDPRYGGAPWSALALAAGLAAARQRAPATFTATAVWLAGATLVYLGRYDCLSTYGATSLLTLPLLTSLAAMGWVGAGEPGAPSPSAPRTAAILVGLVAGAAVASPWLHERSPKQDTGDLLDAAARALPPGAVVVALQDEDFPGDRAAYKVDRLPLARLLPDTVQVYGVDAWREAGEPGPAWFLRTLDCHRPALARSGDVARVDDGATATWRRTEVPLVVAGPRLVLDPPTPILWADCAALDARSGAPIWERHPSDRTTGSLYESTWSPDLRIGLYPLR
jgi:hypothetical protein